MIGMLGQRFFHTGRSSLNALKHSALGKLRKSTGYTVANCKKALELFPDDIGKAEEWLHAEAKQKGWAKWAKVQSRPATQGLIGTFSKDNIGVMVEVNCETDFVSRNTEFQQFVENILRGCIQRASLISLNDGISKVTLSESELNSIKFDTSTLADLVTAAVLKFGERTVMKRATLYKVQGGISLMNLSHPVINCHSLMGGMLGKYGTILAYKKNSETENDIEELTRNLCQHIIGMNPLSLGHLTEEDLINLKNKKSQDVFSDTIIEKQGVLSENAETSDAPSEEAEVHDTEVLKETDETRLLFQPYLLDSNIIVGETLLSSGIEIVDFERYECGEEQKVPETAEAVNV